MREWFLLFIILVAASTATKCQILYRGDQCELKEPGRKGICTPIQECQYAQDLLKAKGRPQRCHEFIGLYPVVCCPDSNENKNEMRCSKYHPQDIFSIVVFGGEPALSQEFPHMAALGFGTNKDNMQVLCGGSLISEQFVLTAAHCIYSPELGTVKWVRLGDLDLKNNSDDARPQDFAISNIFVHPSYKSPSHYHDIALLKLDRKAQFDKYVKPACLHIDTSVPDDLVVTGWGKTDYLGEPSNHLMKANLSRVDFATCKTGYSATSKRRLLNGIVDDSQVCAGHPEGKDTCPGDSGGPLQYKIAQSPKVRYPYHKIVGVTSFGKACGFVGSIGVYTRVSNYYSWIENIVWPE